MKVTMKVKGRISLFYHYVTKKHYVIATKLYNYYVMTLDDDYSSIGF